MQRRPRHIGLAPAVLVFNPYRLLPSPTTPTVVPLRLLPSSHRARTRTIPVSHPSLERRSTSTVTMSPGLTDCSAVRKSARERVDVPLILRMRSGTVLVGP